jgi:hypothetical protein
VRRARKKISEATAARAASPQCTDCATRIAAESLLELEVTPEQLIQRQLDCYNAKDLDGLLATYAHDVSHYDLRGNLLAKGHDELRKRFAIRFAEPDLHAKLLQRIAMGNVVSDYEIIT